MLGRQRSKVLAALVVLGLASQAQAQTTIFESGWEDAPSTGCTFNNNTDNGAWTDYGPSSTCTPSPPLAEASTADARSGTKSLRLYFRDGDGDNGPDFRLEAPTLPGAPLSGTVALSYWMKWSSGWFWATADHKTLIVNTTASSQGIYLNLQQGSGGGSTAKFRVFAPVGVDRCESNNITINRGEWVHIEAKFVMGAGGTLDMKLNGTLATWTGCTGGIDFSNINLGTGLNTIKLDSTYNCFDAPAPNVCPDPNNFEFNADLESAFYDDVRVCTGDWCTDDSGGGGGSTAYRFRFRTP